MTAKRLWLLAAFAALAVMSIGAVSLSAAPSPQTMNFLEENTSFSGTGGYNAASNSPPAVGQGFTFVSTLFKWAGAKRGAPLGHDQVLCTVTAEDMSTGSVQAQCAATVSLPGGSLQLAGTTNFNNPVTNVAVVGGTGVYAGSRGTARIKNIGGDTSNVSAYTIHLTG